MSDIFITINLDLGTMKKNLEFLGGALRDATTQSADLSLAYSTALSISSYSRPGSCCCLRAAFSSNMGSTRAHIRTDVLKQTIGGIGFCISVSVGDRAYPAKELMVIVSFLAGGYTREMMVSRASQEY